MRFVLWGYMAATLFVVGCSDSPNKAEAPKAEEEQAALSVKAQVRAVVDTWLDAQNKGDFKAYRSTYAKRFHGIKRAGARTSSYDRAGWLKDRKRMFKSTMKVQLDKIEISPLASMALVSFVQTWASGTFKDVGPKQLILAQENDSWRIAREEMLSSTLVGQSKKAKAIGLNRLVHMVQYGGNHYVVLSDKAKTSWASGPMKLLERSPPYVVGRKAKAGDIPKNLRKWEGKSFKLYAGTDATCEGRVEGLDVLVRITPHFGVSQQWDEMGERKDPEVAKEIWDFNEGVMLVGRLGDLSGDRCVPKKLTWGHAAKAPRPEIHPSIPSDKATKKRMLKAFRKLPGYRNIQKYYKRDGFNSEAPRWDAYDGGRPGVSVFGQKDEGTRYVFISAYAGSGCGDFSGSFWALWRVDPSADPVLLSDPKNPGDVGTPSTLVDLNGDKIPEFLGPRTLIQQIGTTHRRTRDLTAPNFDCGC